MRRAKAAGKTVCRRCKKPRLWKKVYRKRLQRTEIRTRNKGIGRKPSVRE